MASAGSFAPDLGGAFEFNLQAATGVHEFVRDNVAVTVAARYLPVSSAGLYAPNLGLNTIAGLVDVTWFFQKRLHGKRLVTFPPLPAR